jgi:hypothetical protein
VRQQEQTLIRTAYSIHRTGFAVMRDVHLVAANDPGPTDYRSCSSGTVYFKPQPCDWRPDQVARAVADPRAVRLSEANDRRALALQIAHQIRSEWRPS